MKSFKYRIGTDKSKMTLIIGARCKDGVVLVGDKKVTDTGTGEIYVEDKIKEVFKDIFFASAGISELFEKFDETLNFNVGQKKQESQQKESQNNESKRTPDEQGLYNSTKDFLYDCENLLFELKNRYQRVINAYEQGISVLIGLRNENDGGYAELYYLDTRDCMAAKKRSFVCIGTGAPYAHLFLKELWNENLSMEQTAGICEFIIDYVEFTDLDNYVGKGVQIIFIPDLNEKFKKISASKNKPSKAELKYLKNFDITSYDKPKKVIEIDKKRVESFVRDFQRIFKKYWRY